MHIEQRELYFRSPTVPTPAPRVLVVEDDVEFAELLRRDLEAGGYAVEVASTVPEARRRIREGGALDLVLSDVRLPGGSGVELLFGDGDGTKRPPVLMMSGFVSADLRAVIERAGTTLMEKPFSFGHLHRSVLRILMKDAESGT